MKISWRMAGFEEIRRSPETQKLIMSHADALAAAAGRGYVSSGRQGKTRFRALVFADSWRAFHDQRRNNTLQKVLFSQGGGG